MENLHPNSHPTPLWKTLVAHRLCYFEQQPLLFTVSAPTFYWHENFKTCNIGVKMSVGILAGVESSLFKSRHQNHRHILFFVNTFLLSNDFGINQRANLTILQILSLFLRVHFPEDSLLRLLESRKGEREAQAFVKKRRQREKQSQEGIQQ